MLIDSHCHLDRLDLSAFDGSLDALLAVARGAGVGAMLAVGIDLASSREMIRLATRHTDVFATVGVHPLQTESLPLPDETELLTLGASDVVVAIGETGIDGHYGGDNLDWQRESFRIHARVASRLRKPLVVHTRDARAETLALLRAHTDPAVGGVLHCFTEDWATASAGLELGFYISFSGIVTFRNAGDLREIAARVPIDRLLVETDAPWLAPVPYRGKTNRPHYVAEVARCIAVLRGMDLDHFNARMAENFARLFRVEVPTPAGGVT